ncbi:MAG: aspartate carbamoyltransferase [Candidatus Gracilibacteria bacterium]|jgi:aspartate carbamoyltransferase
MKFKGEHILSTKQFDKDGLIELFELAKKMEKVIEKSKGGKQSKILEGRVMATLFFEPSTRTRFSFETAMNRLGGRVISNFDMMNSSSVKKRETLKDTGKVVSQMADIIAMRHPEPGSVDELASTSDVPVMNAGDGPNQHPTQALMDLYTIWKEFGRITGLTVGMVGDLKYGRVPHSQCDLLRHFNVKFVFVAPNALKMPTEIVKELKASGSEVFETENLEEVIGDMDVIAMTRIQEERFSSKSEYEKYANVYVLNKKLMAGAKDNSIVIHPLPRVNEIGAEVDKDPRAKYFEQVKNGVAIRMALLAKVLGEA